MNQEFTNALDGLILKINRSAGGDPHGTDTHLAAPASSLKDREGMLAFYT